MEKGVTYLDDILELLANRLHKYIVFGITEKPPAYCQWTAFNVKQLHLL